MIEKLDSTRNKFITETIDEPDQDEPTLLLRREKNEGEEKSFGFHLLFLNV